MSQNSGFKRNRIYPVSVIFHFSYEYCLECGVLSFSNPCIESLYVLLSVKRSGLGKGCSVYG